MSVTTKKVKYKQLHCLYSKKTLNQLGPLKAKDPEVESFLSRADQSHYGLATVNFKAVNDVWQHTGNTPANLNFQSQFLTEDQRRILLPQNK